MRRAISPIGSSGRSAPKLFLPSTPEAATKTTRICGDEGREGQDGPGTPEGQDRREGDGGEGRTVLRPHRTVRLRQVAGDPRARGSRVFLRRQPADDADSDAREAVAAG